MDESEGNSQGEARSGARLILPAMVCLAVIILVIEKQFAGHGVPRIKMTITQIGAFSEALKMFKGDIGHYPNGLNDLVVQPAGASTNWHEYLDRIPFDPWGHPYLYEYPGKHRTNSYDLSSAGPDGKFGTEDDIANWQWQTNQ
jgi:general secretion pathway protein G